MTIEKTVNGTELTMILSGRLDTTTAPQLETELKARIDGVEHLVLDFTCFGLTLAVKACGNGTVLIILLENI